MREREIGIYTHIVTVFLTSIMLPTCWADSHIYYVHYLVLFTDLMYSHVHMFHIVVYACCFLCQKEGAFNIDIIKRLKKKREGKEVGGDGMQTATGDGNVYKCLGNSYGVPFDT